MKKNNKKGFTIVELVIVIAVIAILAAVLIPTFSSVVKKAKISADTQLCKNMNTALDIAKADGAELDTMEAVLFAINDAGYIVENLNPTTEGYYFAWNSANGSIVFLKDDFTAYYPENAQFDEEDCWITVGDDIEGEAQAIAAKGFSLYLEPGYDSAITVNNLVNVDAGVNTNVNLTIASNDAGSISVAGNYAALTLNVPNAHVDQFGTAKTINAKTAANTLEVNGYVETLNIEAGKTEIKATGFVDTVKSATEEVVVIAKNEGIIKTVEAKVTITENAGLVSELKAEATVATNNGIITEVATGATVTTNNAVAGDEVIAEATYAYAISNKTELYAFRDAVNAGNTFEGITVTLTADIDLAGVAWLPIGNVYRKNAGKPNNIVGFSGTFDGNGKTIKNLSNQGFAVDGIANGKNDSTTTKENEVVFGLFACVKNATIKNLTVNANITDVGSKYVGDSVGAIVGYAYGESLTLINCKATGSIDASDGIGGLVGRLYVYGDVALTDCVNNATVAAKLPSGNGSAGKAGGFIGYANGSKEVKCDITMTNCTNNGTVTSAKYAGDILVGSGNVVLNGVGLTNNQQVNEIPQA